MFSSTFSSFASPEGKRERGGFILSATKGVDPQEKEEGGRAGEIFDFYLNPPGRGKKGGSACG